MNSDVALLAKKITHDANSAPLGEDAYRLLRDPGAPPAKKKRSSRVDGRTPQRNKPSNLEIYLRQNSPKKMRREYFSKNVSLLKTASPLKIHTMEQPIDKSEEASTSESGRSTPMSVREGTEGGVMRQRCEE